MSTRTDVAPLAEPKRRRWTWQAPDSTVGRAQERLAWLLVAPSIAIVLIVAIYPLIESFRLSLTNTRLASAREPRYIGLDNYRNLFEDSLFRTAIKNTLYFTFTSVAIELVLGVIIALVINSNFKGRGLVRTSMLIPWAIPTVVSALMWQWMFNDVYGVINDLLQYRIGIIDEKVAWLSNTSTAMAAIIAVDVWKTTPFMALLLLAGLQIIPGDVYEAATVDGASKWQQFWQITLPLLRPALLVALIFRSMDAFRIFDAIYVMKSYAPDTMSIAIFTQQTLIGIGRLGEGSAAAVVIFLSIGIMVILYTRLVRVEEA
ncbi:MAG: carbohydrate ABC transporter permease [Thermomicrobiales bacterium]